MKKIKLNLVAFAFISFVAGSCEKEITNSKPSGNIELNAKGSGAAQVSGISYFDATGECSDAMGAGATYAITLTGDLEGCWYVFVNEFDCSQAEHTGKTAVNFLLVLTKAKPDHSGQVTSLKESMKDVHRMDPI